MATLIYRRDENGEIVADRCATKMLHGKLAQGYVVDPAELEEAKEEAQDVDRWDGYSNADIRELAKEAGIDSHKTARVGALKKALDTQE